MYNLSYSKINLIIPYGVMMSMNSMLTENRLYSWNETDKNSEDNQRIIRTLSR